MVTTISQVLDDTQDPKDTIRIFLHQFGIGALLRKCRAHKIKGFPVLQIFTYLLGCMFSPVSTYMSMKIGSFKEPFSQRTPYTDSVMIQGSTGTSLSAFCRRGS